MRTDLRHLYDVTSVNASSLASKINVFRASKQQNGRMNMDTTNSLKQQQFGYGIQLAIQKGKHFTVTNDGNYMQENWCVDRGFLTCGRTAEN